VVQGSKQLGFALESGNAVGISGEFFWKNFYCHVAAEDLVLCLEHLAHAAFAKLASDLIMPERLADHEEALQIDSRCNEIKGILEVGPIVANFTAIR